VFSAAILSFRFVAAQIRVRLSKTHLDWLAQPRGDPLAAQRKLPVKSRVPLTSSPTQGPFEASAYLPSATQQTGSRFAPRRHDHHGDGAGCEAARQRVRAARQNNRHARAEHDSGSIGLSQK
jgi:hypothetical protein